MKKIFFLLLIFISSAAAFAQNEIVVDPNASVRTVNGNFNAIKVSGGINLYLSQSANEAVAISASEDKYKDGIKTVIENGTLKIYYEGDKGWNKKDRKLRVYVSFKNLEKINASGACDVVVSGTIAVTSLDMQLSGACDFNGKITVDKLKLDLSGASDVKISGTANTVDIESSGASGDIPDLFTNEQKEEFCGSVRSVDHFRKLAKGHCFWLDRSSLYIGEA